jgi:hypothetical protein
MHPDSMHGTLQVSAAAPGPSPSPSASPSPSPGPAPPSALVRDVHLPRTTFCVRHCRHPGVVVKLELASAARVRGTLTRKGHRFGRLDFGTVKTGKHTLRFTRTTAGKRLARGRYVLTLRIGTEPARTLRFRVS